MLLLALVFAVWGWTDVRLRGTVDPNHSTIHKTDFTVYTEAGAAFFDGRDPYTVTNPRGWGYLYLPLFAILMAPLHALDPQIQVLVWFALSAVMCWGCYVESVRIAWAVLPDAPDRGIYGPIPLWIGSAAVAAALLPALNCLQRGQVGVAKLYLLLLGLRLLMESRSAGRSFLAGIMFSLSIVLKITPILPVAFMLVQQFASAMHSRPCQPKFGRAGACSLGTALGLLLFVLLLPAGIIGWRANLHHLGTWWTSIAMRAEGVFADDFAGDSYSVRNQSLTNAVHRLGNWADYCFAGGPFDDGPEQLREGGGGLLMDAPVVAWALVVARSLAACLLVILAVRTGRSQDPLCQAAGFGLACVSTLVIVAIARGHYYLLFLPAVLFLPMWFERQQRPTLARFYALVPCALILTHYALLDYAGRIGLLGLGTTIWYAAASVTMIWLSRPASHQATIAPLHDLDKPSSSQPLAA